MLKDRLGITATDTPGQPTVDGSWHLFNGLDLWHCSSVCSVWLQSYQRGMIVPGVYPKLIRVQYREHGGQDDLVTRCAIGKWLVCPKVSATVKVTALAGLVLLSMTCGLDRMCVWRQGCLV